LPLSLELITVAKPDDLRFVKICTDDPDIVIENILFDAHVLKMAVALKKISPLATQINSAARGLPCL
jgi:hypothetical protein